VKHYEPRKYWPERLKKQGKNYVAWRNEAKAFSKQERVFWNAIQPLLPSGGRVLDFGCGVGRFTTVISSIVDQYDGVDLNKEALEFAPSVDNATFTYLLEDNLPFDENTFDGALALTVLQHIVDPQSFELWTNELARVIKPGGFFIGIETPSLKVKPAPHMRWRTSKIIAEALGGRVETVHNISAEFQNSHYCFLARL